MTRTLSVPLQITAEVRVIEGGGYWAEVPHFPGCVAQAESIEALKENIVQAVEDWLNGSTAKTEAEARQLAEIQGSSKLVDDSFPNPKTRRVVVLTPDIELAAGFPIVVAGLTGTLPNPLTADYVVPFARNSSAAAFARVSARSAGGGRLTR